MPFGPRCRQTATLLGSIAKLPIPERLALAKAVPAADLRAVAVPPQVDSMEAATGGAATEAAIAEVNRTG
jgi:hypothetical protein